MDGKRLNLNYDQICRACLSENDLKPIFDSKSDGLSLAEKVMACASVQIAEGDGFPSNMCKNCIKQVDQAYAFKQKCEETDQFLQQLVVKVENNDMFFLNDVKEDVFPIKLETDNTIKNTDDGFYSFFDSINNDDTNNDEEDENSNASTDKNIEDTVPELKCKKCDISFNNKKEYQKHLQTHPPVKRVPCTTCKKEFSINHIYRHMRVHTQEKPFTCHICGKSFNTGFNRDRHIKTHTGERPYQCSVCGKGFIQAVTLQAHIRVHTGETPFMCNHCGKTFKQSRLCRLHVQRRHTNPKVPVARRKRSGECRPRTKRPSTESIERRFACDECDRRFTSRSLLQSHKLHHGEKTFLCSECGKRFVSKVALKIHGIVHSGTKQYVCEICKKAFAYTSSLKTHMLRHTGEKRFSCHLCGSKFLQSAHLKTHLKLHDGTKPFKCSVCGKDFSLKGNLTVHMRIHTGETPYKCPVCGKGFYDSSSMRKHHQNHMQRNVKIE